MKKINIKGTTYNVAKNEFIQSNKYDPVIIYSQLADLDREIFLLQLLAHMDNNLEFINYGNSHDNYVYKNVEKYFKSVKDRKIIRIDPGKSLELHTEPLLLLCDDTGDIIKYNKYIITKERRIYIHKNYDIDYMSYLRINAENIIMIDNLIHITFMIKNSGDIFRDVLLENLKIADQVTILDTGSTDNTIDIVNEIMQTESRIALYQEPFIDFSTSRNRLMDLAEENNRSCVFHIMLDDTYVLRKSDILRSFLHEIRSNDYPSFSINIKSNIVYSSNRIIRPETKLRYKYKIHEIIDNDNKVSALIPLEKGFIEDIQSDYMSNRTLDRKYSDLTLLFEEVEENPEDPRSYYYLAETYLCLKDYENALKYYEKRSHMQGFVEERYDAKYKKVIMEHLYLDKDWAKVQEGYLDCYNFDPTRPESMFMIGYEYKLRNIPNLAHMFLKKSFEIGIPANQSLNIRFAQYSYFLPSYLIETCYLYKDYILGIKCCEKILEYTNNNDALAIYWLNVFTMLAQVNNIPDTYKKHAINKKKILFIADGGWDKWDGETLYKNGIGGSETFTIKYAEWLQKNDKYNVIVCCNCKEEKVFNDVTYLPLESCIGYIKSNFVDYAIVNRTSSYIYLLDNLGIENIYFVAHDIFIQGNVIPLLPSLKGILCISQWAKKQMYSMFNNIPKDLGSVISYGIDSNKFPDFPVQKHSFIYSSFANRGLLELLKMFPRIISKYPDATLNVFCDLDNKWLLHHYSNEVDEIKKLLEKNKKFVTNYGWVNQKVLNTFWSKAHVWLYPCTFAETCCLTSYEAAASGTIAITNDLGALPENVKTIIEGDASTNEWKEKALLKLDEIFNNKEIEEKLIKDGYDWVTKEKNFEKVVDDFTNKFLI